MYELGVVAFVAADNTVIKHYARFVFGCTHDVTHLPHASELFISLAHAICVCLGVAVIESRYLVGYRGRKRRPSERKCAVLGALRKMPRMQNNHRKC